MLHLPILLLLPFLLPPSPSFASATPAPHAFLTLQTPVLLSERDVVSSRVVADVGLSAFLRPRSARPLADVDFLTDIAPLEVVPSATFNASALRAALELVARHPLVRQCSVDHAISNSLRSAPENPASSFSSWADRFGRWLFPSLADPQRTRENPPTRDPPSTTPPSSSSPGTTSSSSAGSPGGSDTSPTSTSPTSPASSGLGGVAREVGAPALWEEGITGRGVRVAVFDTGLVGRHPSFRRVKERINWTNEPTLDDQLGHGTFVAGIVAGSDAATDNPDSSHPSSLPPSSPSSPSSSCPGIAPEVDLFIFRVFTREQVSYTSWFLDAFNYALHRGIHVINLSIGGPDFADLPFLEKVRELSSQGVVLVSAVGNDGPTLGTVNNPADMPDVVAVGGMDRRGRVAHFSSRGMTSWETPEGVGRIKPDLVALADHLWGPRADGRGCRSLSGTSVASPVVAGAVALLSQVLLDRTIELGVRPPRTASRLAWSNDGTRNAGDSSHGEPASGADQGVHSSGDRSGAAAPALRRPASVDVAATEDANLPRTPLARGLVNQATIKQALHASAVRIQASADELEPSMVDQGAGALDLPRAVAFLREYLPQVTVFPPLIDLAIGLPTPSASSSSSSSSSSSFARPGGEGASQSTSSSSSSSSSSSTTSPIVDALLSRFPLPTLPTPTGPCGYWWPFCSQPLFASGEVTWVNLTVLHSFARSSRVVGDALWRWDPAGAGSLLRPRVQVADPLWPFGGWLAVGLEVEESSAAADFDGVVEGELLLNVWTPDALVDASTAVDSIAGRAESALELLLSLAGELRPSDPDSASSTSPSSSSSSSSSSPSSSSWIADAPLRSIAVEGSEWTRGRFAQAPPPLRSRRRGVSTLVRIPVRARVAPTPARARRVAWDVFHSLRYPPAFVPRDDLLARRDVLDGQPDHPFTNLRMLWRQLRAMGFFVDIIGRPWTEVAAERYGLFVSVDAEDEWHPLERSKLVQDVKERGLGLFIFADWYDADVLAHSVFFDENTRSWWRPVTGGANVPALNDLLDPFGIQLEGSAYAGLLRTATRDQLRHADEATQSLVAEAAEREGAEGARTEGAAGESRSSNDPSWAADQDGDAATPPTTSTLVRRARRTRAGRRGGLGNRPEDLVGEGEEGAPALDDDPRPWIETTEDVGPYHPFASGTGIATAPPGTILVFASLVDQAPHFVAGSEGLRREPQTLAVPVIAAWQDAEDRDSGRVVVVGDSTCVDESQPLTDFWVHFAPQPEELEDGEGGEEDPGDGTEEAQGGGRGGRRRSTSREREQRERNENAAGAKETMPREGVHPTSASSGFASLGAGSVAADPLVIRTREPASASFEEQGVDETPEESFGRTIRLPESRSPARQLAEDHPTGSSETPSPPSTRASALLPPTPRVPPPARFCFSMLRELLAFVAKRDEPSSPPISPPTESRPLLQSQIPDASLLLLWPERQLPPSLAFLSPKTWALIRARRGVAPDLVPPHLPDRLRACVTPEAMDPLAFFDRATGLAWQFSEESCAERVTVAWDEVRAVSPPRAPDHAWLESISGSYRALGNPHLPATQEGSSTIGERDGSAEQPAAAMEEGVEPA